MRVHKWSELKRRSKLSPERIAQIERESDEELQRADLKMLREMAGKTQTEVAKEVDVSQAEISRAEGREENHLSFLKRHVRALGGDVEVYARFKNRLVRLY
ncbi:MAG TPA: helix-turn-helix domain-containing protein [Anaeromyxobacteraceae bacterium]|nr:helix-turn-helix domain-containing protein [Anaeromyxobacteraceae bacterium]